MRSGVTRLAFCLSLIAAACAGPRDLQMTVTRPTAREHSFRDDASPRTLFVIFAILAIASLSACSLYRNNASWSDELSDRDAASLAGTLAVLVSNRIALGEKPILLVPAANSDGKQLAAELKSLLEARGYVITEEEPALKDAHRLRYFVTAYTGGYVLRVSLSGAEASTMLSRGSDGQLIARAPLAVRELVQ